jgi:hypothetical protein
MEKKSNEMCHSVISWINKHNDKVPSHGAKDPVEKRNANWLSHCRKAYVGKGNVFFSSDLKIAKKYGFPDLFAIQNYEKKSNEMCKAVFEWMKKHNDKCPNQRSKDPVEKKYGTWLKNFEMACDGEGTAVFYPSNAKIAESYGYHV